MSSGKVKCTCGWSWNKSDSSKKDMYICHECGRDNSNNMKNGGWLDSYANGGTMQEHQENYNNSEVSLPEGFVGMGNNTKGRNYSPAWGGQFQMGGVLSGTDLNLTENIFGNKNQYETYGDDSASNLNTFNPHYTRTKDSVDYGMNNYDDEYMPWHDVQVIEDEDTRTNQEIFSNYYTNDGFNFNDYNPVNEDGIRRMMPNPEDLYNNKNKQKVKTIKGEAPPPRAIVTGRGNPNNTFANPNTPNYQMGGSVYPVNYIPQAQDGIQKMSPREKRNIDLLIEDMKDEKKDLYELQNTGQVKNPRSILNQKKKRESDKKKTYVSEDKRTDYEKESDEAKGRKKETKRKIISTADEATDLMQLGNFIPNPIAQTIGEVGNIAGAGIDAYQAAEDFSEGNYEGSLINAASATLPALLARGSFARNSKYLKPGEVMYPLSPQAFGSPARTKYLELFNTTRGSTPFNTNVNRTLLGALGAEAAYDLPEYQMGGSIPGAVGFSYARVGAPSKGPRRNQTDVTDASAQNGQEMKFYQEGLDWKPKSISKNGGWLDSYENGGVVKDDMGYWNPDNWDSPVEIGSNEITMKDVPFDVLGISDEGDIKHMKPGKNYKYKGKKVTEYRMAKNGLRQEQKGLVNLDQLTNFTNYNKPQPGGWLNKYN